MPWLGAWRWLNFDIQEVEASERPDPFGEDVRYIEELVLVAFQAGDFEEDGQVVNLLLAVAFLGNRGIASQLFGGYQYILVLDFILAY
jgi:hypothetical protein